MTTILTVDDDPFIRKLLRLVLGREGFDIVSADNGHSALKQLKNQPVDLVITDIFMPEKDGLEFISEMKTIRPDLKVIAISGGGAFIDPQLYLTMAKTLGAVTVLTKPVQADVLIQTIHDLLSAELVVESR